MKVALQNAVMLFFICILTMGCAQNKAGLPDSAPAAEREAGDGIAFREFGFNNLAVSKNLRDIICQTWDNREDALEQRQTRPEAGADVVSRGFCFFPDGRMVKNPRSEYRIGKWRLIRDKRPLIIVADFEDGAHAQYAIGKISPFALTLDLSENKDRKELTEFMSQGISYQNLILDPFAIENNGWRIRPSSPETEEGIKRRLKGCVHFFSLFYYHNINTKSATVNFSGLPGCFRWYAGGIYLYKEKDIPQSWINCFYNKVQAMQAYGMAAELIKKKYNWPKGEQNWVKLNAAVLKQMDDALEAPVKAMH